MPGFTAVMGDRSERKLAMDLLDEQAKRMMQPATLLNLAHDAIVVRKLGRDSTIVFWSAGAVNAYGWTKVQAVGQSSHTLLKTVFPKPLEDIEEELNRTGGWQGTLEHRTASGATVHVASRWTLQRDVSEVPESVLEIDRDITAQELSEENLRAANAQLGMALEAANMGAWRWDLKRDTVWADERMCGLFGLPGDLRVFPAKEFVQEVHADDRDHLRAEIERSLESGRFAADYRVVRPDASILEVSSRGGVTFENGRPARMDGICWDITGRVPRSEEPGRTERRFQQLVEAAPNSIILSDADGTIRLVNSGTERLFGYSRGEILGLSVEALLTDSWGDPTKSWRSALPSTGGRPMNLSNDHSGLRKDGSRVPVEVRLSPLETEEGAFVLASIIDMTEHRKKQRELAAQEAKFRFLAECMPQIVWAAEVDGTLDYLNKRWHEFTGSTGDQADTLGWKAVLHPDDAGECLKVWEESLASGEPFQVESRLRRGADQGFRWHLGRALPQRDEQGAIVKWFGTWTDVNDYKEAEEENLILRRELEGRVRTRTTELEAANLELLRFSRKLEESNRELQDFASVAAHDLQEPLRKVQTFGDRLMQMSFVANLDETALDYFKRMLKAVSRMQTLINDLLAFAHVANRTEPFELVDLQRVADEVLSDLETRIAETGATVEVGRLPAVEADATQMRQLFQNLIGNSLKFRKPGEKPRVRVSGVMLPVPEFGGMGCRLEVEDSGIGFEEKFLDRIFTVFQKLHSRKEYEGTGVGLAICRKIVRRHGGEISATSSPGNGATFIVMLPSNAAEERKDMRVEPEALGDLLSIEDVVNRLKPL